MRPHERRESNAYPYFKLASWDARNLSWKDGKGAAPSIDAAKAGARKPGRYRVSEIDEAGRRDLEPFVV